MLPNAISARNMIDTPVLKELSRRDCSIVFLSNLDTHKAGIESLGNPLLRWAKMDLPTGIRSRHRQVLHRVKHKVLLHLHAEFGNLVYRFNEMHGFRAHHQKKKLPLRMREREALSGNYLEVGLGKPFPESKFLQRLLTRFYYGKFWSVAREVTEFFDQFKPDLLVLGHCQHITIADYVRVARRRRIPMTGIIASWDQPTTKGPLPISVSHYLVQNASMVEQLEKYHDIPQNRITITGWPQMDGYAEDIHYDRNEWLNSLGFEGDIRYALFAANTPRLGQHEIAIIQHIVEQMTQNSYGKHCALIIRPHPGDREVMERFSGFEKFKNVILDHDDLNNLHRLHHLLHFANITLASGGTFALDSIAHDTPTIGLALSEDESIIDRVRQNYTSDHYRELVETGAISLCRDFADLDQSLARYLQRDIVDSAELQRAKRQFLTPYDGKASSRIVDTIFKGVAKV
ncbi:MAG: hypothetical protein ACI9VI_003115 [Candidatus Azotimanducaceae bacterium]